MLRFFLCLLVILCFFACSEPSNPNELDSDDYTSKRERVEILKKEIKSFSDFEDAEFELFNVNGFSNSRITVPGASSWNYKFVIKLDPSDIDKWTNGMVKIEAPEFNAQWMKKIIEKRENEWKTNSKPEFYIREGIGVTIIVYRPEGIIFKQVINN